MTGRILVVDDVAVNRKLMAARLVQAYYSVATAESGEAALAELGKQPFDLVLLDVMMPGLGGYETCRRIKADPALAAIPVVLVTLLDQPRDREEGMAAGADDFLIKPVSDLALLARVRSLTRLKLAADELRTRLGPLAAQAPHARADPRKGSVLLVAEDAGDAAELARALKRRNDVQLAHDAQSALARAAEGGAELAVLSLQSRGFDPLRLLSELLSSPATRHLPVLVAAPESEESWIWKALDLGAADYVPLPLERFEILARVAAHIGRSREETALRRSVHASAELAVRDALTGLGNRRFMEMRLAQLCATASASGRGLCVLIADIDHFKHVNDRFGHAAGDLVLKEFAVRLPRAVRGEDVACRYGGEEFVVLIDGADEAAARRAAERLRESMEAEPFHIEEGALSLTVSVGVARLEPGEEPASVLRRADRALYDAKNAGRNRVGWADGAANSLNHS